MSEVVSYSNHFFILKNFFFINTWSSFSNATFYCFFYFILKFTKISFRFLVSKKKQKTKTTISVSKIFLIRIGVSLLVNRLIHCFEWKNSICIRFTIYATSVFLLYVIFLLLLLNAIFYTISFVFFLINNDHRKFEKKNKAHMHLIMNYWTKTFHKKNLLNK